MKYSMRTSILSMLQKIATARAYEAEHMLWPTEDNHNMADVLKQVSKLSDRFFANGMMQFKIILRVQKKDSFGLVDNYPNITSMTS